MPTFSVLITAYNRADYLRQAIESVNQQTCKDYELIIVDDGSTDENVGSLLDSIQGNICVIRQDNAGQPAASNKGVAAAKGEYIAFLDSDDLWYAHTLNVYLKIITKHNRPSIILGKPQIWNEGEDCPPASEGEIQGQYYNTALEGVIADGFIGSGAMVIKRELFHQAGGFLETRDNGFDIDLLMKLSIVPGYVQIMEPYTFAYRMHEENSIRHLDSTARGQLSMLDRQRKGFYPGGAKEDVLRRAFILTACRNWSIKAAKQKQFKTAMQLYTATLKDHLKQVRVRYLLGLPVLCLWKLLSLTAQTK